MFGKDTQYFSLIRTAMHDSHQILPAMDKKTMSYKDKIPGYKITYQTQFLRHFTCHFEKLRD